METLGGARTLRGFREYRYRDRRNLLLNLEYRWEVWNYVDFGLFADAGKVFRDPDDLDFGGLQAGYGFGLRVHTPGGTQFRIDLARSNEGIKLHVGGGPRF
jgi:outer membrane protein assembly factor BamA